MCKKHRHGSLTNHRLPLFQTDINTIVASTWRTFFFKDEKKQTKKKQMSTNV